LPALMRDSLGNREGLDQTDERDRQRASRKLTERGEVDVRNMRGGQALRNFQR